MRHLAVAAHLLTAALLVPVARGEEPPTLIVRADDTAVSRSCRVVIPPDTTIEDKNGDGVLHVTASSIVVEFAEGSVLRGAAKGTPPDKYGGCGISLAGHAGVTIRGARISGYWCGIRASRADGLVIEDCDASDCRRARLVSTPEAEAVEDWLRPHDNDRNEWLTLYGAAIYIEDSTSITVRRSHVSQGQNGLCLDRVNNSKIYDNDFSFNSGWGIAMWRSSDNVISRNACDFCIRGYSHGVYNRGQDSAGILMFEQNNGNLIAENSATHCGDGFFGHAGNEALGEVGSHPVAWHKRRGNSDNLLIGNDFSDAAAHGIEMTFSFRNRFIANRLSGNAICGIWAGYSQDTLIARNTFEHNGGMGYGLERGGVNIEHGRGNRIVANTFHNNKCGVHLWWDKDENISKLPWVTANGADSTENIVASNTFRGDDLAMHFRGRSDVVLGDNDIDGVGLTLKAEEEARVVHRPKIEASASEAHDLRVLGDTRPVGARKHLRGRENIIMTEWGPWDHDSPLIRLIKRSGQSHTFELRRMPEPPRITVKGDGVEGRLLPAADEDRVRHYVVNTKMPGVHTYSLSVSAGDYSETVRNSLAAVAWSAVFFEWSDDCDPRKDLPRWRALARRDNAVSAQPEKLDFKYKLGGPGDLGFDERLAGAKLGRDHFGMIAKASVPLASGKWKIMTLSDDGVRVTIDGKPVIDDWAWHPPKRDEAIVDLPAGKTIELVVEHFEIDGYAVLVFDISRVD
ncbi:MAG: right-handed parallel beta-helix repeat-containing protein [Planctomycetota bacterium]